MARQNKLFAVELEAIHSLVEFYLRIKPAA
jgi:hypothetical protein